MICAMMFRIRESIMLLRVLGQTLVGRMLSGVGLRAASMFIRLTVFDSDKQALRLATGSRFESILASVEQKNMRKERNDMCNDDEDSRRYHRLASDRASTSA